MALDCMFDDAIAGSLSDAELATFTERCERMVLAAWYREKTERELEVSFRMTNDAVIHELNRDYRGVDKPTDVLAFALREGPDGHLMPEVLGDIVISVETAKAQAKNGLIEEILFLFAHGLCHLLGYDHQDDDQEAEMNQRMSALMAAAAAAGPVEAA